MTIAVVAPIGQRTEFQNHEKNSNFVTYDYQRPCTILVVMRSNLSSCLIPEFDSKINQNIHLRSYADANFDCHRH